MNSGGGVCYTAGFREVGQEGVELEKSLLENVGDFALIGPNCYGMINYVNKIALWPFDHGGEFPGFGAAIIIQSGMLSNDLSSSIDAAIEASANRITSFTGFDGFVALGCVIKGQTPHFDLICEATFNAIMTLSLTYNKPIGNGIITAFNLRQAHERCGIKKSNKKN